MFNVYGNLNSIHTVGQRQISPYGHIQTFFLIHILYTFTSLHARTRTHTHSHIHTHNRGPLIARLSNNHDALSWGALAGFAFHTSALQRHTGERVKPFITKKSTTAGSTASRKACLFWLAKHFGWCVNACVYTQVFWCIHSCLLCVCTPWATEPTY